MTFYWSLPIRKYLPREVDIRTKLTKNITLNVPLLSSAMDTVTEANLAIALAREGGLGILHKNMSIEKQVEQVRKVKRSESGLILDPITLHEDATIGDALRLMKENKIGGIPIVSRCKKTLLVSSPTATSVSKHTPAARSVK